MGERKRVIKDFLKRSGISEIEAEIYASKNPDAFKSEVEKAFGKRLKPMRFD